MRRWQLGVGALCLLVLTTAATCQPIPEEDNGTPTVYVLAWNNNGSGGQGSQVTVQPGGTFTVNRGFLGATKANIRVYGEENPGITTLTVTGKGNGVCSTRVLPSGLFYTSLGRLNATLPTQTQSAPSGQIQNSLTVSLDDVLSGDISCGEHIYANMPQREEFFFDTGTWTLHAEADNCCGGKGIGDFTIVIE